MINSSRCRGPVMVLFGLFFSGPYEGFAQGLSGQPASAHQGGPATSAAAAPQKKGDAKSAAPITITALGNKLIVTSEDPEALEVVSEMVRLLTSAPTGADDFQVIRLKFASAVDTAKLLDEAYNGPKPIAGFNPNGGFNPGGGGKGGKGGKGGGFLGQVGGGAAGAVRADRIRVVADPATNALLVKASPLDILTIRDLIEKQLDGGATDALAVIKTQAPIVLKNLYATDVYYMLRDLYRESMDNNARGYGRGGGIVGAIAGNNRTPVLNIDANGNSKGVTLTLAIDDKTNSLLLACPTPMYNDIKKLIDEMEIAAVSNKQTVKFVRIPGVDPAVIQQAMDALQGRTTTSAAGFAGFGGNRGGFGGGPPGGGGGNRGGAGFGYPAFMPAGGGGPGGFAGSRGGGGGGNGGARRAGGA